MEMLVCNCRRRCVAGSCSCVDVGLKYTDACSFGDCENRTIDDNEDDDNFNEDNIFEGESDEDSD